MIRYLALAFIFFQVATTTALATQVVLFEDETAAVALLAEPASGALAQPNSPLDGEMAGPPAAAAARLLQRTGRPEGRTTEHLLIQIYAGKQI
ncbi:hypothetical protein ACWGS9_04355 [Bradyrhizobium sp. Arg314]